MNSPAKAAFWSLLLISLNGKYFFDRKAPFLSKIPISQKGPELNMFHCPKSTIKEMINLVGPDKQV